LAASASCRLQNRELGDAASVPQALPSRRGAGQRVTVINAKYRARVRARGMASVRTHAGKWVVRDIYNAEGDVTGQVERLSLGGVKEYGHAMIDALDASSPAGTRIRRRP
jgi:hypothetical protein